MPKATVSHHWVNLILNTASLRGANLESLPISCASNPQRYDLDDVVSLWEAAVEQTQDTAFGLHAGENLTPAQLNILGHIILSSHTALDGFIKAQRYYRLISEGGEIKLDLNKENVQIIYLPHPQTKPFIRHQIESVTSSIYTIMKWILGQHVRPTAVHFKHEKPVDTSEHERIFQCPIYFSQDINAIEGPTNMLSQVLNHDDTLTKLHEQMAEKMLNALDQNTWADKVIQLLEGQMGHQQHDDQELSKEKVASQLNVTSKTLQRRLSNEGTQFSQLLNETRERMAMHYLEQHNLSMDDITGLLGFAEPSAFFRAFKRWTGKTPRDFQRD